MKSALNALLVALLCTPGWAAVIDTFTSGAQAPTTDSVETVGISGSLFETRYLQNSRFSTSQQLEVTTDAGLLFFEAPPRDGGYFNFGYRSSEPVNLLARGADRLRLGFTSGGVPVRSGFLFYVTALTTSGRSTASVGADLREQIRASSGAFQLEVPFDRLVGEGDLSEVTELRFQGARITNRSWFELSSIGVVPEPATPVLFLVAMWHLMRRRSRRQPNAKA